MKLQTNNHLKIKYGWHILQTNFVTPLVYIKSYAVRGGITLMLGLETSVTHMKKCSPLSCLFTIVNWELKVVSSNNIICVVLKLNNTFYGTTCKCFETDYLDK